MKSDNVRQWMPGVLLAGAAAGDIRVETLDRLERDIRALLEKANVRPRS